MGRDPHVLADVTLFYIGICQAQSSLVNTCATIHIAMASDMYELMLTARHIAKHELTHSYNQMNKSSRN